MNFERPGWDEYYMGIALAVSTRSNCLRRRVGALIVVQNAIIAAEGVLPLCQDTGSIQIFAFRGHRVVTDGREPPDGHPSLREKDIERHLRGEGEPETGAKPEAEVPAPKKTEREGGGNGKKESAPSAKGPKEDEKDPQLERAVDLLKGWELFKSRYVDKPKAS